jgi:hypothetical protein
MGGGLPDLSRLLLHGSRGASDEYEIREAPDVRTVMEWADEQAAGRSYILYALVRSGNPASSGLLTLMGHDPNRPTDPRRPTDVK